MCTLISERHVDNPMYSLSTSISYWRSRLSTTLHNSIADILSTRHHSILRSANGISAMKDESRHVHIVNASIH